MFNVLTDAFKEQIKSQYKKRKVIVWLVTVICLQASFIIFIVPSYFYLVSDQKDLLAQQAGQGQNNTASSSPDIATIFNTTNNKLSALLSGAESNSLGDLIAGIVSLRGSSIRLNEIIYHTDTATSSVFQLQGVASDRDSLLSFSKRIEADPRFENVDLPVSNFAKDKNINFSMTVRAKL